MLLLFGFILVTAFLLFCLKLPPDKAEDSDTDTEFTAEVVAIATVRKHPGADRLEIATFSLARSGVATYEVVVGAGQFKPGNFARYFSVDCLLPLERPEFAFLKSKDHPNRKLHRLRAARLRGVYSQGLLVPAEAVDVFGTRVAKSCGVGYYREEEQEASEAGYKAPRAATFAPVYGVDSLKKVPNLFKPDDVVLVTEKVHGMNFRFGWLKTGFFGRWKFHVGSHRADLHPDGDSVWARVAKSENLANLTSKAKGLIFYGEVYGTTEGGKEIQQGYSYGYREPRVRVFDVRKHSGNQWLSAKERLQLLTELGIIGVPVLMRGHLSEISPPEHFADGPSIIDGVTPREGCVVEIWDAQGDRRKGKYVGSVYLLGKEKPKAKAA